MFLSPELHFAIEQEIASLNSSHLVRAYEELSQHYRQKSFEKVSFKLSKEHCVAYAASRMPATYEVAVHIFTELFKQRPELALESVLDIGAGPGTCAFALSSLHTFKKITLVYDLRAHGHQVCVTLRCARLDDNHDFLRCF